MNKFLTKIAALSVGLAMAIGVGVAVGNGSKESTRRVKAATGSLTVTASDLGYTNTTYSNKTAVAVGTEGFKFSTTDVCKKSGTGVKDFQLKRSTGYLWNSDCPSGYTVTSIQLTNKSGGTVTVKKGSSAKPSTTVTGSNDTYNINDKYFSISGPSAAAYFTLVINYSTGAQKLTAPSPSYNDTTKKVSWADVEHASSYQVKVDSGSYATATSPYDVSGLTTGVSHTVYVIAKGDGTNYTDSDAGSTTFTPTAPKVLSSISVSGQTTAFEQNDTFVFGGTVTAHYTDSTSSDVTSSATFSGYNMSTAGNQTVTVSYTLSGVTKTTTYDITVAIGPDVVLNTSNKPYTSTSSSNTGTEEVTLDGIQYNSYAAYIYNSYLSFNRNQSGAYLYNNTAYAKNIDKIVVNYNSGGSGYFAMYEGSAAGVEGTTISPSASGTGKITYTFSDTVQFFKFKLTTTGTYCNIVSISIYLGSTPKTLSSIAVKTAPSKTAYKSGEAFNAAGLVITATYSDTSTEDIAYDSAPTAFSFSPATITSAGNVTITYREKTCTQAVTLITVTNVTGVASAPTEVYKDGSINPADVVLNVTYSDSSVGTVTPDSVTCDTSSTGTATATATYNAATGTKSATFSISVVEEPLSYVINFGSTKNTNPTEIKTDASFKSTWPGNQISDVTVGDFSKIYGVETSQLKCGSGSATASISFTIPSDSYIVSVVLVVETAGGTSMNVVSGATGAQTENQAITAGTLTFDDYLASEKSNYVLITSTASGAFYLSSITINYANFAAELTASPSSFEVAVNNSQNVTLTPSHFTPTSYTAVVKSGSSLTASAVSFNGNTATIAAGSTTGITVFTITGTGGGKTASVDVTVDVTQVRNLLTLSITTASDATSFKVGDTFDVGSLVITATFDADPTTVVYSKANGNIGALEAAPEIGYEFQESDIGTVTSAIFELEVGTGDEMVEYSISVADKTYAHKVTDVQDLWDGQQIYFGNGTDKVNIVHAGGNQLGSQDATIHETKGLCVDDLAHSAAYTVHREKIDGTIYYSFENGGYYLEASSTSQNYLTRTDTISDNCRYTISISSGEVTMTNKGNGDRPEFRWNTGSHWFTQYASTTTMPKAVIYAITPYSEQAVADAFTARYLHMDESVSGQCNTYYPILKPVWAAMGEYEKAALSADAEARLNAWAAAHGEHLDSDMNLVSNSRINILGITQESTNTAAVVIVISLISVAAIGGYFFLRKRKEQ